MGDVLSLKAAPLTTERPQEIVLPHNTEVEQALLAAIMVSNRTYDLVADVLRPEHFAEGVHGRIFEACGRLIAAGRKADPVTLKTVFDQDAALKTIGGAAYLATLARSVVTIANARDYAEQILDLWRKREIVLHALEVVDRGLAPSLETDAAALADFAEGRLYEIMESERAAADGLVPLRDVAHAANAETERVWKAGGKMTGVDTGLADLNRKLGGLQAEDLIVLGARPSMGKTSLASNIALAAARSFADKAAREARPAEAVAFFSLEMGARSLGQTILAQGSDISADRQRKGHIGASEFERLVDAGTEMARLPLFIDSRAGASTAYVRTQARRLARKHRVGLIVIDYLQLMRQGGKAENRRLELGEITGQLKGLAKWLSCPVLLLSQLSRGVELRDDKRPILADLRESGDIEQDADVVMFLYREEYYLARSEPTRRVDEGEAKFSERLLAHRTRLAEAAHRAEILIAKNRLGPIGKVTTRYDAERSRFEDLMQGGAP